MAEKVYVGKGKVVGNFGNIKVGLRVVDLKANDKGYVNLIISKMKETDKYGNEFTVYIDDFVPQSRGGSSGEPAVSGAPVEPDLSGCTLPF